jgi:hypothetical protein
MLCNQTPLAMRPGQTPRLSRWAEGEKRSLCDSTSTPQKPQPSSFSEPQDSHSRLTAGPWRTHDQLGLGCPGTACAPTGVQRARAVKKGGRLIADHDPIALRKSAAK